ncbi:histidinol-phosphate transaminase [Rehaibacterium terrae]|jgi:histidinol-phosphate aminotransferase|uniref:Histidinol-phosphate aminotransferase n=1 Tax=Rehaibacterium terrae TaxID=1341696 RepID=A0A7W7XXY5_9GAMM|nr:histidinol-phosphate transaminase [Rehaibacterium terrae]MBB5014274.1 histidinol-phosphate aminotransferase [Rehaibacterium terrae]
MSDVLDLVREDLRQFAGYASARRSGLTGSVWLNANESPWPSPADGGLGLNRYPDPQPAALHAELAALYAVDEERVLISRGSDEAIDLLVRALCRAGRDAVVLAPPTFGMYAVCARLQDARRIEVPLIDTADGWALDIDAVIASARDGGARIVFLCSPNNPTGEVVPREAIERAAVALADQAVVVVDEAYGEFAAQASAATLLPRHPNLAVLRTLSKAHALAGARIGALLADPALIRVLRNVAAPYPLPSPSVRAALAALQPATLDETRRRIACVIAERQRVFAALSALPGVRRCYPSQGNFLLVRFVEAELAFRRLLAAGVVVRDMRGYPGLGDALRISIGTVQDNDTLLAALGAGRAPA